MPPPVSFLTISAVPYTQVVTPAMFNVNDEQWFQYTATAPIVLGLQTTAAGTFTPFTTVFEADGTTPVGLYVDGTYGHWHALTAAGDYYVQVLRSGTGESDADFTVTAETRPLDVGMTGISDLIINDDANHLPAAVVGSDGDVRFFAPAIPGGETGAILPSGVSFWHDFYGRISATERIAVIDADLAYVTSVACGLTGSNKPRFGTDVTNEQVYVVNQSRQLWTISAAGVAANTGYTFPSGATVIPDVIGVNADGTVLYWANIYSHGDTIHALDLTTFTALPDLHTIAGFAAGDDAIARTPFDHPGDLFVMPNGTVVTWWYAQAADTYHLLVLTSGGPLFAQYWYAPPVSIDHLAYIPGDSDHIWVWWFLNDDFNIARFGRLTLATGAIDQDFTVNTFSEAVNETGTEWFGPSTSCTFVRRSTEDEPPPPDPPGNGNGGGGGDGEPPFAAPSYHLDGRYIRRLRRAPHVNNEHLRVFYRRFELDLERGQALASGQGSEPYVLLRLSRDGGQTWGEEQRMAAGHLGEYQARVLARRLGHGRDLVFEVVVSDPVAWSLVGAWLDLEPGTN